MPSEYAQDIVNALFSGQKDLSDYVDAGMKTLALDAIDDLKQQIGMSMFETEEEEVDDELETEEEETDDEADYGES
jgi:flagellar capping protein FliD